MALGDDGLQQTGVVISGPPLLAIFAPEAFAIIGQSDGQHFIECIVGRQDPTASTGIAIRTTSKPTTSLANRLIPVPLGFRVKHLFVCDLCHL